MAVRQLTALSPTEFENLVFDLVRSTGMRNLQWRTPGPDGGRDLEGEYLDHDFAGSSKLQRWYIEMKRYTVAVDWPTVWEKLSYADNAGADFLLMVTTSSFSPRCLDEMAKWNAASRRPTIRGWPAHELDFRVRQAPAIGVKYGISEAADSVAPALAPLMMHLAKTTIAAENCLLMTGAPGIYLIFSSAISELLMVRSEDFAHSGRIVRRGPMTHEPWYPWLQIEPRGSLDHLDIPTARALVCGLMLVAGAHGIEATRLATGTVVLAAVKPKVDDISAGLDLFNQIALWGDCEVVLKDATVTVRPREI